MAVAEGGGVVAMGSELVKGLGSFEEVNQERKGKTSHKASE